MKMKFGILNTLFKSKKQRQAEIMSNINTTFPPDRGEAKKVFKALREMKLPGKPMNLYCLHCISGSNVIPDCSKCEYHERKN